MEVKEWLGENNTLGQDIWYNKYRHENESLDECSMINSNMYYNLLKAIGNYTRIIFVGDALQLPPIGMGNIFLDILKNDTFRTYKLTEPMRQAKDSGILSDANQIRVGINPLEKPEPSIKHGKLFDMFYKFRGDKEQLHKLAIKMYMQAKTVEYIGCLSVEMIWH